MNRKYHEKHNHPSEDEELNFMYPCPHTATRKPSNAGNDSTRDTFFKSTHNSIYFYAISPLQIGYSNNRPKNTFPSTVTHKFDFYNNTNSLENTI